MINIKVLDYWKKEKNKISCPEKSYILSVEYIDDGNETISVISQKSKISLIKIKHDSVYFY